MYNHNIIRLIATTTCLSNINLYFTVDINNKLTNPMHILNTLSQSVVKQRLSINRHCNLCCNSKRNLHGLISDFYQFNVKNDFQWPKKIGSICYIVVVQSQRFMFEQIYTCKLDDEDYLLLFHTYNEHTIYDTSLSKKKCYILKDSFLSFSFIKVSSA